MKETLRDQPGLAMVLEALAGIASARGDGERAATLLGAAQAIWTYIQGAPAAAPFIAAEREVGEALARSLLGRAHLRACLPPGPDHGHHRGRPLRPRLRRRRSRTGPAALSGNGTTLTAREAEVAALLGEGLSNQEIADRLVISVRTAQGHVENILRKLGFSSRAQVAAWVVSRAHAAADSSDPRRRGVCSALPHRDADTALLGDLDRPVVARVDVPDDAHPGVVGEHPLDLLRRQVGAVGDARPGRRGSSGPSRRRRRGGSTPRSRRRRC